MSKTPFSSTPRAETIGAQRRNRERLGSNYQAMPAPRTSDMALKNLQTPQEANFHLLRREGFTQWLGEGERVPCEHG